MPLLCGSKSCQMLSSAGGPQRGVQEPQEERKDSGLGGDVLPFQWIQQQGYKGEQRKIWEICCQCLVTACEQGPREVQLVGGDMCSPHILGLWTPSSLSTGSLWMLWSEFLLLFDTTSDSHVASTSSLDQNGALGLN